MHPFAVVIVNYNTREDLQACLQTVVAANPCETAVADNGSTDGSREMVQADFPEVNLLCFDENPGYGSAANRAIAATRAPYVLLLNSDTLLIPDALKAMERYLDEHPSVAILGPRLLNVDGSLQPSCFPYPGTLRWLVDNDDTGWILRRVPYVRHLLWRTWTHSRSMPVPWVLGAALAIRRSAFEQVGGFDESFFMYHEETDLSLRLSAAGWETHFAPIADVVHLGAASTRQLRTEMFVELYASRVRFHEKHYAGLHRRIVTTIWNGIAWARLVIASAKLRMTADQECRLEIERDRAALKHVVSGTPLRIRDSMTLKNSM